MGFFLFLNLVYQIFITPLANMVYRFFIDRLQQKKELWNVNPNKIFPVILVPWLHPRNLLINYTVILIQLSLIHFNDHTQYVLTFGITG